MAELKLLIVEDDPEVIKSYKRDIKSFNLESEVKINATLIFEKDEAINLLKNKNVFFDAAIVDLKLDSANNADENYSGNEVLREIKGNLRFPVFVITGTPQHIAEDLKTESSLFKLKVRGEEDNHLQQLVDIYNTGITNILGRSGAIEKYLNEIFWKHLSNSMETWITDTSRTPEQKEKSLLRYTLSHIQEHLDLTDNGDFEHYIPSEFYIIPPVKPNIFTGDIIEYSGKRCLVLTPACDFGNRKAENILCITIKKWESLDAEFVNRPLSTGKTSVLKNHMSNKTPRYHFIPKIHNIDAGFIDFQDKITIEVGRLNNLLGKGRVIRSATISAPFLKDVISRYSSYYSRQGSPDFQTDEIYNSLFA